MLNFFHRNKVFGAYYVIESDLILLDCKEGIVPELINSGLLEEVNTVHIFVSGLLPEVVQGTAEVIRFFYQSVFKESSQNICVYYPDMKLLKIFEEQKISSNWYVLYANLWDYVFVLGQRKLVEYAFTPNSGSDSFAIEMIWRKGPSLFYSGYAKTVNEKLKQGSNYDYVFQIIEDEKQANAICYSDFVQEWMNINTQIKKQNCFLIMSEQRVNEITNMDGFQYIGNMVM